MVVAIDEVKPDTTFVFEPLDISEDRCKGCGLCVDECPKQRASSSTDRRQPLGYHPSD